MKKKHVLTQLILIGIGIHLTALNKPIMIHVPEQENYIVQPRQVITAAIRVTSLFEAEQELLEELHLPEGWKLITGLDPFHINPNETQVRMISALVPSDALAGEYHIFYYVRSRRFPEVSDHIVLNVRVNEVKQIQLVLLDVPDLVMAGQTFEVRLLVSNASNVADTIIIDPGMIQNFAYKISKTRFELQPGSSKECRLQLTSEPNLSRQVRSPLQIQACSKQDPKNCVVVSQIIDVIPLQARKPDIYHRFPVNVSIKSVWQNYPEDRQGNQIDIAGSGSLDENGKQLLKFRIRTPDLYDTSILGEYSEYYAVYENVQWNFGIGDQYFTLSPLLEFSIYSRGLNLSYKKNEWTVGAYAHQTRFLFQKQKQMAAYVQYPVKEGHRLQLSYLHKMFEQSSINKHSDMLSIQYNTMIQQHKINAELATAFQGKHGNAFNLSLTGNMKALDYNLQAVQADDRFYGYYSNRSLISSYIRYKMSGQFQLMTRINQNENRFYTPSSLVKILSSYQDVGLRYNINRHFSITTAYGRREQKDEQTISKFNFRDNMGILQLAYQIQKLSFSARYEQGWTANQLSNSRSKMNRFNISVFYQPRFDQMIQLYLLFDRSGYNSLYDNQYINGGFNASARFWKKWDFSVHLQNYLTPESYYNGQNTIHTKLNYEINSRNSLALQLRRTVRKDGQDVYETAVLVQYNYRFDAPIRKKKTVGYVKGTVIDQETGNPMPGAHIRINGYVEVTDESGRFTFDGLAPGIYYLDIDKTQIGLNRVCTRKMPMPIDIQPGEVIDLTFYFVQSARIEGKIMLYKIVNDTSDHFSAAKMVEHLDEYYLSGLQTEERKSITNSKTLLVPDTPVPHLLVLLKRDDETIRQLTDNEGEFSFEDLRPGKWELIIDDSHVPDYNEIEINHILFYLKPEDSEKRLIRILPRRRKIQFLDKNESIIQEKPRLFKD
jgi:protocatechuate 3,4-dioxygenase beta subunit